MDISHARDSLRLTDNPLNEVHMEIRNIAHDMANLPHDRDYRGLRLLRTDELERPILRSVFSKSSVVRKATHEFRLTCLRHLELALMAPALIWLLITTLVGYNRLWKLHRRAGRTGYRISPLMSWSTSLIGGRKFRICATPLDSPPKAHHAATVE